MKQRHYINLMKQIHQIMRLPRQRSRERRRPGLALLPGAGRVLLHATPALPVGLGFRVQGSGFRVQGSGFWVQSSGCRVYSSSRKYTAVIASPVRKALCRVRDRLAAKLPLTPPLSERSVIYCQTILSRKAFIMNTISLQGIGAVSLVS